MANREAGTGQTETEPRPAAVTFVTTEHFTLQGARSSTIAEATGRATMFLGAVSGGLVALGLIATAAGVGTAFTGNAEREGKISDGCRGTGPPSMSIRTNRRVSSATVSCN